MGKKGAQAKKEAAAKKGSKAKPAAKKPAEKKQEGKDEDRYPYIHATGVLESQKTARDVKIGAFALSSYGNELVKDTMIELTIGRRYGLLGANGSGKSTLLKCLAARQVPIPDFIDIWFLENEAEPSEFTAMQFIITEAEREAQRLEDLAETILEEDGPESDRLQDVYDKLEEMDPKTFESRAGTLLYGLGFSKEMMAKATKDMSGGWRMRVALAQALFIRPTLLLLDEPTNHLDLEACVWLEQYLAGYPYCLVVISHSQDFLNNVCNNIVHITPKKTLQVYTGNYDMFVQTKGELEVNQMKQYEKEQADIKHIKQFIASCGTFSNLVKQAKSKQKILDKMEAKGLTEKVAKDAKFSFVFAECEKLPPPVLSFSKVSFSYSGLPKDYLYTNVDLGVDSDSRVALVGPNGAGKSTLLKLMVGDLQPCDGLVRRHIHLQIGRYHQHSHEILDEKKPVLHFIRDYFEGKIKKEEDDWRKVIGRYGITGERQMTPIGKLSDGLKTRIVFALLSCERPNLLLLDEPTNHLDMECIDALADAIKVFDGGVVLVSHDFRLIDQVAKELWVCDKKSVTRWQGDIRSYKKSLIAQMKF